MATADLGRATPPPLVGTPPKYTLSHYEEVTNHTSPSYIGCWFSMFYLVTCISKL